MNIKAQTGNLYGTIHSKGTICGTICKPVGYADYTGSYDVVPKFEEQTLQTASKLMRDDVVVKEITVTKIANSSGGNTVIIGS